MATQQDIVIDKFFNFGYMRNSTQTIGAFKIVKFSESVRELYYNGVRILVITLSGELLRNSPISRIATIIRFISANYTIVTQNTRMVFYKRNAELTTEINTDIDINGIEPIDNNEMSNLIGGKYENV